MYIYVMYTYNNIQDVDSQRIRENNRGRYCY